MIKGFTRNAIVMFPYYDDYEGRGSSYTNKMERAASKLKQYLNVCDITYDCFNTDEVATLLRTEPDRWVSTLNQGDSFFVKQNCEGSVFNTRNMVYHEDVYLETAARFPIDRGTGEERRFELILKRDSKAKRDIAKKYKLVVLFKASSKTMFKYTPKAGSGILYLEIDAFNFIPKCWMSDTAMDVIEILGVPNGNAPVYEWEVPVNGNEN